MGVLLRAQALVPRIEPSRNQRIIHPSVVDFSRLAAREVGESMEASEESRAPGKIMRRGLSRGTTLNYGFFMGS